MPWWFNLFETVAVDMKENLWRCFRWWLSWSGNYVDTACTHTAFTWRWQGTKIRGPRKHGRGSRAPRSTTTTHLFAVIIIFIILVLWWWWVVLEWHHCVSYPQNTQGIIGQTYSNSIYPISLMCIVFSLLGFPSPLKDGHNLSLEFGSERNCVKHNSHLKVKPGWLVEFAPPTHYKTSLQREPYLSDEVIRLRRPSAIRSDLITPNPILEIQEIGVDTSVCLRSWLKCILVLKLFTGRQSYTLRALKGNPTHPPNWPPVQTHIHKFLVFQRWGWG